MRCFVGIDLGSTTTKAVVLDEEQRILGRGITNSRSNYAVACSIARKEAFADVQFTLCGRALERTGLPEGERAEFLAALDRSFRLASFRAHLAALGAQMWREKEDVERYFAPVAVGPALESILATLDRGAEHLFRAGAPRRSDFFRDTATSEFHRNAVREAAERKIPFEALLATFDKAILKAENQEIDIPFEQGAGWAIERAIVERGLEGKAVAATIRPVLRDVFTIELDSVLSVGTGYGRATLPFEKAQIRSEILCHGLGAHRMFPGTRTVLDIGGQDTKAVQVDEDGIVTSFQMNDRCAAGCGRYLGYIADEMNLGLHELGPLAQKSTHPVKINSTCTVFAGAEIRDRLTLGQRREDVLAGLHRAVILRAMSLLARSGGIQSEFTFTGGVAKNVTAVKVLQDLVLQNYGAITINISPDSIYTGALGAAIFAYRGARDARSESAA
jgi:benzoyl-CoA reductase subunit A